MVGPDFQRIDPTRATSDARPVVGAPRKTGSTAFADALRAAQQADQPARLEFSKHAAERLEQRRIELTDDLLRRLGDGLERAASKGSRTSLILVDQTAFIVGVPQRTVVTVADSEALRERVFTNIDSMVIA